MIVIVSGLRSGLGKIVRSPGINASRKSDKAIVVKKRTNNESCKQRIRIGGVRGAKGLGKEKAELSGV